MHDESQINTIDPLDGVSNHNINDSVRKFRSENDTPILSEAFPCVLSEEDAEVVPRKAVEEIINDTQDAESSGVKGNAMDGVKDMVPCDNKRLRQPPKWLGDYVQGNM
ncbi:hypothetical protein NDU88_005685 [Pleurodeles waltl]|uniref:Uncharacterized protein n=1 Tax=Pleurodeles waltl TaxID=8319 RepID=A0AAV7UIX0_PLEWA|nr:hypothetical protein NDU88_005685 [Pleurodeles waltl]